MWLPSTWDCFMELVWNSSNNKPKIQNLVSRNAFDLPKTKTKNPKSISYVLLPFLIYLSDSKVYGSPKTIKNSNKILTPNHLLEQIWVSLHFSIKTINSSFLVARSKNGWPFTSKFSWVSQIFVNIFFLPQDIWYLRRSIKFWKFELKGNIWYLIS